jgi:hypothetical protein
MQTTEERQEALEAVAKQCGTCKHWRFMGDKLQLGAWGFCIWGDHNIQMLIPYWMRARRDMYISTNHFEGSDCGAWKDKRYVNGSGLDPAEES